MRSLRQQRAPGFTLLEILVVLSVIGILVALLIPAVRAAREASRRMNCANNLRQLGIALHQYMGNYQTFPPYWAATSWDSIHIKMLPYLEQSQVYSSINFSTSLAPTSSENSTASNTALNVFLCVSDGLSGKGMTNYVGCVGDGRTPSSPNGAFAVRRGMADITDGLTNTAAMSEFLVGRSDAVEVKRAIYVPDDIIQGAPNDYNTFVARCTSLRAETANTSMIKGQFWMYGSYICTLYNHILTPNKPSCQNTFSSSDVSWSQTATSNHPGGVNLLWADGHVSFVKETVTVAAWQALATCNGGEVFGTLE